MRILGQNRDFLSGKRDFGSKMGILGSDKWGIWVKMAIFNNGKREFGSKMGIFGANSGDFGS